MSFNCYMHERNIYKDRPDFAKIAADYPEFKQYALPDRKGKVRLDFHDPNALRTLTRILLEKDFDLHVEIPDGYLIPTVPQRLNYILWIEDLLTVLPKEKETVSGIDIGTGPCAILSLLGAKKNDWHFLSTETADEAIQWAKKNIENNNLGSYIKVVKVNKGSVILDVMAEKVENFDFCVCNPPFFENKDDIRKKSARMKEKLDLFAKKEEIFSEGGEVSFVKQLLKDSIMLKDRIKLFSSMFGKKKSFIEMLKELQNVESITYTKTEFCQGNTIRWGIAWTFLKDVNFERIERPKPKKPTKQKPPLMQSIKRKLKDGSILTLKKLLEDMKSTLLDLQIQTKILKSAVNYAEIEILSDQNTWSHQRRKRREKLKSTPHETDKKYDLSSESSSYVSDVTSEKQSLDSSKTLSPSAVSHTDLEREQAAENDANPCLPILVIEEKGTQKAKSEKDHSGTVSLDVPSKMEVTDSAHSLQDLVPQIRKRDENESTLEDEDNKCILPKDPDCDTSPKVKRFKISEDSLLSEEYGRKMQSDCSPKKEISIMESHTQQEGKSTNHGTVQTHYPTTTFETPPLLYSIIKLRTTKEIISFEINCPAECNRETMHQVHRLPRPL